MENENRTKTCTLKKARRHAVRLPHYRVEAARPLGNNPGITAYLSNRRVWDIAQNRLCEVYYYVEDEKGARKNFFAAGWKNELNFWEVESPCFRGALYHTAITFVPGAAASLITFEDYFSYLSWLADNPLSEDSVLVLNPGTSLASAISKAKHFPEIGLFFNRDANGKMNTLEFIGALPHARDLSSVYKGYKNYNDRLVQHSNAGSYICNG